MNFDVIFGLVVLFFVYRVIRGVLKSLNTAATNAHKNEPAQATPTSPEISTPVYRSPRDMTARPATKSSVPRSVSRMKSAMAVPVSQRPVQQSGSPFIIDQRRRFPLLGILAVATIIVLISSCYAWINETPQRPAPGRNADRAVMQSVA